MKTSQLLKQAKSVIEKEENWCQRFLALSKDGSEVQPYMDSACKFCSIGALDKAHYDYNGVKYALSESVNYLQRAMKNQLIVRFNDFHTHAEVMQAWDKAIKLAEADENS